MYIICCRLYTIYFKVKGHPAQPQGPLQAGACSRGDLAVRPSRIAIGPSPERQWLHIARWATVAQKLRSSDAFEFEKQSPPVDVAATEN